MLGKLSGSGYAELFCQSNFSFLEGASHPQELVSQAALLGYQAIAITDECSVAGIVRAYTEIQSKQLGIKLIVGSLFKLNDELELVLLCPNIAAYSELCRIITNARRRASKGHYQLNKWDLKTARHCLALWLPKGDAALDRQWAKSLKASYAKRLWIGYRRHLSPNEQDYLHYCTALADEHHLPLTACGAVLFHHPERLPLQHVLTAIRHGSPVDQLGRVLLANSERALRPLSKLKALYSDALLQESLHIAALCNFSLDELRYQYPQELVPAHKRPIEHLRDLVEAGIQLRFPKGVSADIRHIIDKELTLIEEQAYEYFFLTIADIVCFAQLQGILYQGRGSAANSVVCYCLQITAVDPRQIDVLFERFISKERNEPPDIDVDFEHERREEIIQYIYQKYGRERAAIAATVITYRQKSALRDVGKALGIHATQLDFFINNINHRDQELGWQAQIAQLGLDTQSSKGQQFIALVNQLRGFPRHLSQHVGGFVISQGPLYQLVPIENAAMPERSVIQWDKDDLESLKLLKVDILALGMLSAIRKSFELITQHYQYTWSIPQLTALGDDPQVYQMIQQADTVGVFQIESRAQMSMLPRLRPNTFYDLVIQIAIVRPGPIQGGMVHPFLKRRDKREPVEYPSAEVKSILQRTEGVPIFQEQVIKLAMVAAGFSGGEADQLRRAMGSWKHAGELEKFHSKLVDGMLKRNYTREFAERLYQQICGFGEYGFPESHSASFAVLAYTSAWLKHYYPAAFYVALLNSWPMGFYAPAQLLQDAQRHAIKVFPLCINQSQYDHSLELAEGQWAIRLGLRIIKSLTESGARQLIEQRPEGGYRQIEEVHRLQLNQADISALASANVFQALNSNRYASRWQLMNSESTLPLFVQASPALYQTRQPNALETLYEDYHSTGLYLQTHPITLLEQAGLLGRFTPADQLSRKNHQQLVTIVGVVTGRQRPGTSKGVTFMTLEDHSGSTNVIVYQGTARQQLKAFLKSTIVKISGLVERGDGGVTHVIAGKIQDLSHLLAELNSKSRDFH